MDGRRDDPYIVADNIINVLRRVAVISCLFRLKFLNKFFIRFTFCHVVIPRFLLDLQQYGIFNSVKVLELNSRKKEAAGVLPICLFSNFKTPNFPLFSPSAPEIYPETPFSVLPLPVSALAPVLLLPRQ